VCIYIYIYIYIYICVCVCVCRKVSDRTASRDQEGTTPGQEVPMFLIKSYTTVLVQRYHRSWSEGTTARGQKANNGPGQEVNCS